VLPDSVHADVQATTRTGRVRSDFAGIPVPPQRIWARLKPHGSLGREVTGRLGGGGPLLVLSSTSGDIAILRAASSP
jgi:hypothetical protein